ncbi:MAG: chorismate-binding protein [Candidatus Omnitrophota bacterium]
MIIYFQFERQPLFFDSPLSVISANDPLELSNCFRRMGEALEAGYYLAGFLSYEAGYCFEERFSFSGRRDFPLLLMGVYKGPLRNSLPVASRARGFSVKRLRINTERGEYADNIELIRRCIASGEIYQLTYCIKFLFDFSGSAGQLYSLLLKKQPVPYPAYLQWRDLHICSLSPELFFKKRGPRILAKPMKGTWRRGDNYFSDLKEYRLFRADVKNRAENVMIADLLRNDLGKIGGKVRAPRLFEVNGYSTLFQMTSTVSARVPENIPLCELFKALFPSGSVTGAPKLRAMRIIREIEKEPRNIYTGAIGYITPAREMFFNVPIRTLLIRGGQGEMGIGGGIVWDSTADGEWNEGVLKAEFFTSLTR